MNARSSLTHTEILKLDDAKVVTVDGTHTSVLKNVYQSIFVDQTYADTGERRKSRARKEQDEFLERILELEHNIISACPTIGVLSLLRRGSLCVLVSIMAWLLVRQQE